MLLKKEQADWTKKEGRTFGVESLKFYKIAILYYSEYRVCNSILIIKAQSSSFIEHKK